MLKASELTIMGVTECTSRQLTHIKINISQSEDGWKLTFTFKNICYVSEKKYLFPCEMQILKVDHGLYYVLQ